MIDVRELSSVPVSGGAAVVVGSTALGARGAVVTAGDQLRAAIAAALDRERHELGEPDFEFDEREQQHLDAACRAADAVELLDQPWLSAGYRTTKLAST